MLEHPESDAQALRQALSALLAQVEPEPPRPLAPGEVLARLERYADVACMLMQGLTRPDAVAPGATGAAPGSATEAAPPGAEQGGGENTPSAAGGEGQRSSAERDAERDEVVRRLAGQGLSQRQIRRQLSKRGWSIAQDRLAVLCHEGRAAAAPVGGERLERGSLLPG